jgi:hypothetical protein
MGRPRRTMVPLVAVVVLEELLLSVMPLYQPTEQHLWKWKIRHGRARARRVPIAGLSHLDLILLL